MKSKIIAYIFLLTACGACQAKSESLADIYRLALLNDPIYRAAEVELNIGKNSTYKAWARFLPQLNLDPSGTYSRSTSDDFERTTDGVTVETPGRKSISKSARLGSLRFNLGIDQWFTFKNNLMGDEHAQLTFAKAQQELIIRVTEKYFNVLKAHAQLQIAQKAENEERLKLTLAEERLSKGLNTVTDTHTAKTNFYSAQITTQQRMVALDQAFEELTLLTGRPHYNLSGFGSAIPAPDPSPLDAETWVRSAVQDSYDVQLRRIDRERARNNSKADKYYYLPTISTTINGGAYSSTPGISRIEEVPIVNPDGTVTVIEREVTTSSTRTYRELGNSLNVQLSIPLFGNNGLSRIERKENAQREQIAHENFLKSYRETEFQIRSQFMNILNQKRSLQLQEKRLEQAQLAYDKTKIEYEHGSKSLIDLTTQQSNLLRAEISQTEAQYGYIETLLRLKQQAGKLTPEDVFEIDSWLQDENKVIATQRNTITPIIEKQQ